MLGALTEDQFEQLRQQLIVPLAVRDILGFDLNVEPEMQYGLHMALSEIDPDSALLAIAICAQDIANKAIHAAPIAHALTVQCNTILNEYGPLWLRNNLNAPIPSHVYQEILDTAPEDLECIADLLDALEADLGEDMGAMTPLIKLLSIQARAHMEIADFVLAEIAYEKQVTDNREISPQFGYVQDQVEQVIEANTSDNIIVFPGARA